MAFDGTLKFDTAIDKTGFKLGLDSIGSIAKMGMGAVTAAIGAATAGISALGAKAIESGKSFEAGMSQIQATLGFSIADVANNVNGASETMEKLSQKAEEMGRKTAFSATRAAEGLNTIAMAGYGAEDAVLMIENGLNLASAGHLQLDQAMKYVTGSMKGFTKEAEKLGDAEAQSAYFADIIAKGATMAATDVNQLGEAFSGVAATANGYNQTAQATEVALLRLAEQGIVGSEAATHLSQLMKDLYTPTDQAKEAFEELGVTVYDETTGMQKDVNTVVDEINAKLDEIRTASPEGIAKAADLENIIFGQRGQKAFDKMIVSSAEKVQSFYNGLEYTEDGAKGSAAKQAEAMLDNLEGDMTLLKSAAEGLYNSLYKSMNGTLRELVQLANGYVTELTEAFTEGGFEGLAQKAGDVLGNAVTKISGYLPDIVKIGSSLVSSLMNSLAENAEIISNTAIEIILVLVQAITDNLGTLVNAGVNILVALVQAVVDNLDMMIEAGFQLIQTICEVLLNSENIEKLLGAGKKLLDYIVNGVKENFPKIRPAIVELIGKMGEYFKEHYKEMLEYGGELIKKVANGLKNAATVLLGEVVLLLDDLGDEFSEYGWLTIGADIVAKIGEGIKTMYDNAVEYTTDLIEKIVNAIKETDWIKLGKDICDGILSGLVGFDADFYDYLDYFKGDFLGGLFKTFEIGSPSKVMRDEVGKYLAEGIGVGFADNIPDVGEDALNAFRLQSADVFGTVRSSPTSEITHNYTYYNSTQNADGSHSQRGDIIIPVSIGGQEIETFIFSAIQLENMRTGGGTV